MPVICCHSCGEVPVLLSCLQKNKGRRRREKSCERLETAQAPRSMSASPSQPRPWAPGPGAPGLQRRVSNHSIKAHTVGMAQRALPSHTTDAVCYTWCFDFLPCFLLGPCRLDGKVSGARQVSMEEAPCPAGWTPEPFFF